MTRRKSSQKELLESLGKFEGVSMNIHDEIKVILRHIKVNSKPTTDDMLRLRGLMDQLDRLGKVRTEVIAEVGNFIKTH